MKSLGIDIGSSSVKVSLLDIATGECVASATNPAQEMPIEAQQAGWAEQDPEMWWRYVCEGIRRIGAAHPMHEVVSVGITYQMHGLVCLDRAGHPLRKSIIWCDSRAVGLGAEALEGIGRDRCLRHTLNSPGNFTASKLAWVKRHEPELFARIDKFLLPGDYIAYRLSGHLSTSVSGLSEQILWDFKEERRADFVADYYGIPHELIPEAGPSIGVQCETDAATERLLGIPAGTPISYRAGDQPNNAFSLNVLEAGAIDATIELGGDCYVFWGGREGYMSLLNTDMKREKEHMATMLRMARDYARAKGFKGTFLVEPKPMEPMKHQYDVDTETVIGFLRAHGLDKDFKVNIEVNHATLADHTFEHELQCAVDAGMLGSIDANRGDYQNGWDTDQFPIDLYELVQAMLVILRGGGLQGGGTNFDAKTRRNSTDLEDIFIAHIAGMDTMARALLIAADILDNSPYEKMVKERYASYDSGEGKAFEEGRLTLEQVADYARTHEPVQRSGRQELYEALINLYI